MLSGDDAKLFSALGQFGYSLFEPDTMPEPNKLLAQVAASRDVRVLEGFPIVLANALERERSSVRMGEMERHLDSDKQRRELHRLVALAAHVFTACHRDDLCGVVRPWVERTEDQRLRDDLLQDKPLSVGGTELSLGRLKRAFDRYFVEPRAHGGTGELAGAGLRDAFRQEYLLSLLLSPRQKDLVYKKLRGAAFTKTEREYFSRVVKKKLQAMADPDLQRLAHRALQ